MKKETETMVCSATRKPSGEIHWNICCGKVVGSDDQIQCTLYEKFREGYEALIFLIDQGKGLVEVTSEAPAKLVDIEYDTKKAVAKKVELAF